LVTVDIVNDYGGVESNDTKQTTPPQWLKDSNAISVYSETVFLKIHGARCGVEKGTQMGGLSEGKGEILSYWCKFSQ
jgi:hypothetical protein